MPWTIDDVDRHKKGLSKKQKERWVAIANSVLSSDGDEGKAIRIANVKSVQEDYWSEGPISSRYGEPHMNEDNIEIGDNVRKRMTRKSGKVTKKDSGKVTVEYSDGSSEEDWEHQFVKEESMLEGKMRKVSSIADLFNLAATDERYQKLALMAHSNLGGPQVNDYNKTREWFETSAQEVEMETGEDGEKGIVDEINFCIPLVTGKEESSNRELAMKLIEGE